MKVNTKTEPALKTTLSQEQRDRFIEGLPMKATVNDVATMWMAMALSYHLTTDQLAGCVVMIGESVTNGTYEKMSGQFTSPRSKLQ